MANLDQVSVFNYVVVPKTPVYRSIIEVFFRQRDQRYNYEMRPGEVLKAVQKGDFAAEVANEESLELELLQLVEWGNLTRSHDAKEVTTIQDYYRKHWLYRLTTAGWEAHKAVAEVEATVGKSGSLQIQTLRSIEKALKELVDIVRGRGDLKDDALPSRLKTLTNDFAVLSDEGGRFMDSLISQKETTVDSDGFRFRKQALLKYVDTFVHEVRGVQPVLAAAIETLENFGSDKLIERAALHEEHAPSLTGADPAKAWTAYIREKWDGIRDWIVGKPGVPAQITQLANAAVGMVSGLLRTLERLNDRLSTKADRKADFMTLAKWFSDCLGDGEAHELGRLAFGLHSAKHFHIAQEDDTLNPAGTSWWAAEPVPVPIPIRKQGKLNRTGRVSQVADYSDTKAWIKQNMAKKREEEERAIQTFLEIGEFRISELDELTTGEFEFLRAMLDQTLRTPIPEDGVQEVKSYDGRFNITLIEPEDDGFQVVETKIGTFYCRDFTIRIEKAMKASLVRKQA